MIFVTTDEHLKEGCSGVSVDLRIESMASFVEDAEQDILLVIGEGSKDQILGDTFALLVVRKAVVNMALEGYASTGAILISDTGMHVSKSEKLLPASDKKLLSFRQDAKERGCRALSDLVLYMEGKRDVFTVWAGSAERLAYFNTIFYSYRDFARFAGLTVNAHLFEVIRPQITFVEEDVLVRDFGEALVSEIRTKLFGDNFLTPKEEKLLWYFRRIVGPLSVAEAIPYRAVQVGANGVFQASVATLGSGSDNVEGLSIVQQRVLNGLMVKLNTEGESNLVKAKKWLEDNKTDFPLYKGSVIYPMDGFNDPDSNVYLV